MNIEQYLDRKRVEVDRFLEAAVPPASPDPAILHDAIRYSLLAGGKRIRPILTIAAAEAVGNPPSALLAVASAVELIHTYSLIHDDLPAMDNDDFRRGKPTNHKVFGEAMAILAGDALQTMAFEFCTNPDLVKDLPPSCQARIVYELVLGAGRHGMVAGQVLDIQAENQDISLEALQNIHVHKTGRLIRAAVRLGAILSDASPMQLTQLTSYAEDIGLAFQIADDVLNVTGTQEELGKGANTDAQRGKRTYPHFYGIEGARTLAQECVARAVGHLDTWDAKADPLRGIAHFIVQRRH